MPRFRPFKGSPTPDCPPLTDAVEVVNGKRYLTHSVLDKELPATSFYDLEKLVDSNDVKLEQVNPVLFPATHMSFDVSQSSESSESKDLVADDSNNNNKEVNNA